MGRTRKSQHITLGKSLFKKGSGRPEMGTKVYADRHSQEESTSGLKSVTQETSYEEFIATATLADQEFTAEKLNVKFVSLSASDPLNDESNFLTEAEKKMVVVPRRPAWTREMSPEELDQAEKDAFLDWRRHMAQLQEKDGITPFERNIEVWRQLWRVIERSEIVVQILDGRNPLLYRCEDLEAYVEEMGKRNVLLINKADFLTESQRIHWTKYFDSIGLPHAYYSATTVEKEPIEEEEELTCDEDEDEDDVDDESEESEAEDVPSLPPPSKPECDEISGKSVLGRKELIQFLNSFNNTEEGDVFVVGFCGHPNVGKSSTINSLMAEKKTSVSSTPGKTKHFQTLFLEEKLMLCDCPGLVMPTFGGSQGEMVLGGILPIDTLTNYHPSMALLSQRIPQSLLEKKYGITLPQAFDHNDLLSSYASIRGFMTVRGLPDASRACRIFLKDYVNGKTLFCHAPPNVDQAQFSSLSHSNGFKLPLADAHDKDNAPYKGTQNLTKAEEGTQKIKPPTLRKPNAEGRLDASFFAPTTSTVHVKGQQYISSGLSSTTSESSRLSEKPWKKHNNRNKHEKLRRMYRHLDVE